jgi:ABC-type polysaccharide/polyol phosphate export permease
MTVRDEVSIAGVAWPVYKLLALAIGFMVLVIVAFATSSAAPSVLAAAAAGTAVWLVLSPFHSPGR